MREPGRPLRRPCGIEQVVVYAAFSGDGTRVVTASDDYTARVWDVRTGSAITPPLRHGNPVGQAEFVWNDSRIASIGQDETVRFWDAATGLATSAPFSLGSMPIRFSVHPNGRILAVNTIAGRIQFVDLPSGKATGVPLRLSTQGMDVRFSATGRYLLAASLDGTARLWDLANAEPTGRRLWHARQVADVGVSADGRKLITGSGFAMFDPEGHARVWDSESGEPLTPPLRHATSVYSVRLSPDGKTVMTGSRDGAIRFWSSETGEPTGPALQAPASLTSLAWSPDGLRIAAGTIRDDTQDASGAEGVLRLFEFPSGRLAIPDIPGGVNHVTFGAGGRFLAVEDASSPGRLRVLDSSNGVQVGSPMSLGLNQRMAGVDAGAAAFSGDRLVFGADGEVCAVDPASGTVVKRSPADTDMLTGIRSGESGGRVIVARFSGEAEIHDIENGKLLCPPLRHGGTVNAAALSPDERWAVTTNMAGTARVWEAQTGQPVTPFLPHGNSVWDVEFLPDGERFVTGSQDLAARVWKLTRADETVEQLEALATILSSQRISSAESPLRAQEDELRAAWSEVRKGRRGAVVQDAEKVRAWSTREGEDDSGEGNWAKAILHFDRAIEAGPPRATLLFQRGTALAELGQWDRAATDFAQAAKLRDWDAELWAALLLAQVGAREEAQASKTCSEMLTRFGSTRNPDRARWTAQACSVVRGAGLDRKRIVELANVALEVEPAKAERLELLSLALRRAGDSNGAAEAGRKADAARAKRQGSEPGPAWRERVEIVALQAEAK